MHSIRVRFALLRLVSRELSLDDICKMLSNGQARASLTKIDNQMEGETIFRFQHTVCPETISGKILASHTLRPFTPWTRR